MSSAGRGCDHLRSSPAHTALLTMEIRHTRPLLEADGLEESHQRSFGDPKPTAGDASSLGEWPRPSEDHPSSLTLQLPLLATAAAMTNFLALFLSVIGYYAFGHTNKFGRIPFLSQAGMQVPERFIFTGGLCVGSCLFTCTTIGLYLGRRSKIESSCMRVLNTLSLVIGFAAAFAQVLLAVITMDTWLWAHLVFAGICFSNCILHCTLSWIIQFYLYGWRENVGMFFWRTFWLLGFIWGGTLFVQYDVWSDLEVVCLEKINEPAHDRMAVGQYLVTLGLAMYALSYNEELRGATLTFDGSRARVDSRWASREDRFQTPLIQ